MISREYIKENLKEEFHFAASLVIAGLASSVGLIALMFQISEDVCPGTLDELLNPWMWLGLGGIVFNATGWTIGYFLRAFKKYRKYEVIPVK